MALTHWWPIYLGVAAAALPVVVHWLTRPRPVKLPISTLRFVREAVEQRRARHRLRDFVVLALRTAAVLLLAWAVARPLIGTLAVTSMDTDGEVARVVLLDASQSMATVVRGAPAFEIARSRAADYMAYRPGLRANLIVGAARARSTFDEVSPNLEVLHDVLAGSQVQPERLNVEQALATAGRILAAVRGGDEIQRELVVVSDFQRTNWSAADFSVLPEGTQIQLESVAAAAPPRNLAVLRAAASGRPAQDQPTLLEVEIGNFSDVGERVRCEVAVGQTAFRLEGLCPAKGKLLLSEDAMLATTGWQSGVARLVDLDDALAADNQRHFVVEVLPPPTYALLSRQSPRDRGASSFYVARALAPYGERHQSGVRVVHVDPDQADAETLAGCELIVLDHPGKLSEEAIGLLAGLLRRGRAVLFVASESIDAVTLGQLAKAAGSGLQLPVEFQPPEPARPRHDLFLARLDRERRPFNILGDSVTGAVGTLRFGGGLASRRIEGALSDDLVAEFNDRSAALVVSSSGAGALAVLNADLAQSNLPASPLFVALLGELVERLLGQRQQAGENYCGEPLAVYLPAAVDGAAELTTVGGPSDQLAPLGEFVAESAGIVWRMPAAPAPGVYRLQRAGQDVFALATALPPEESDLRSLGADVLKDRLAGGRAVSYRGAADDDTATDSLWTWLAVAAVACMLAELVALRTFRT